MSFNKELIEKRNEIENYLNQVVSALCEVPEPLQSSIKYSLLNGGKRFRPILFLETYKLFSGSITESVIRFMSAIECIHTYSLIHDDLPCMDNDDFRRGKATNHKVYGEGIATLAGDALLNFAYELLFEAIKMSDNALLYVDAAQYIGISAGARGLIAGQTLDIYSKNEVITSGKLSYIYQHKTCDLIAAAMVSAAIIGGASKPEQKLIREFADNFGYAFQIKDDILDFEESSEETDKQNFVYIFGLNNAKSTLADSIDKAIISISKLNYDTTFFKKLALKSIERKE